METNKNLDLLQKVFKEPMLKITRPLNFDLFIETADEFHTAFTRLLLFLADMRQQGQTAANLPSGQSYLQTNLLWLVF